MNKEETESTKSTESKQRYEKPIIKERDSFVVNKIEEDEVDDIEEIKEPFCPKCGSKMVLRTARQGRYAGSNFWGCSQFPKCKSIINI